VLLADGGMTLVLIGGVFLAGVVGLVGMVLRALLRVARLALRVLLGREIGAAPCEPLAAGGTARVCRQSRCGHVNRGAARHCARCGSKLDPLADVDCHG
jgi:hypothetical protein